MGLQQGLLQNSQFFKKRRGKKRRQENQALSQEGQRKTRVENEGGKAGYKKDIFSRIAQ